MLKMIGILIIIAVLTLSGFKATIKLKERARKLGLFIRLINEIEDNVRLKTEIGEIFKGSLAKELLNYENFCVEIKKDYLLAEEIKLLEDFFQKVGFGDVKTGTELCKQYKDLLGKKEKEAEQESLQKAKLYSILGFFSGLFVAVLLI